MTNPKQQSIESPLAQAMKQGTLGGRPPLQENEKKDQPRELPSGKPKRDKQSVYLTSELLKWVKHRAVDQNKEISEIVEEALQHYRSHLERNIGS